MTSTIAFKYCLVTGASSGIGRALVTRLSHTMKVIAVARSFDKLERTQALGNSKNIAIVSADVSTEEGRDEILKQTSSYLGNNKLNYLVHNAGVIGEIAKLENVTLDNWRQAMATNLEAPLFLTQKMLKAHSNLFAPKARILHVSSGAAHSAIQGWTTYCCSKAALFMLYRCMNKELKDQNIYVGSFKPGVIDSAMQDDIRAAKPEEFQLSNHFKKMKTNQYNKEDKDRPHRPPKDGLDTPANVAFFAKFLLEETSNNEFSEEEWDIRDEKHFEKWIK